MPFDDRVIYYEKGMIVRDPKVMFELLSLREHAFQSALLSAISVRIIRHRRYVGNFLN